MKDLTLWRWLGGEETGVPSPADLLQKLACRMLTERFPFLGRLARALDDPNAEIRRQAVGVLGGADGPLAFRHLVKALNDKDRDVRMAAVTALRHSVETDPARWIHALFHHEIEVRTAAFDQSPPLAHRYLLHLLADDLLAPRVLEVLDGATIVTKQLPVLLDLCRRGRCPRPLARRWIARIQFSSDDWVAVLAGLPPDCVSPDECVPDRFGALGELVDLFFDPGSDTEQDPTTGECPSQVLFEKLRAYALTEKSLTKKVNIASLMIRTGQNRETWNRHALGVCALLRPSYLFDLSVPHDARYRSIEVFYAVDPGQVRCKEDSVQLLLESPLCRRPSGNLDLWAVGGLLHLLRKEPYGHLLDWFGLERVMSACLEDLEAAAPLFAVPDDAPRGRRYLLDEIGKRRRPLRNLLHALLVYIVPANRYDFLDAMGAADALETLLHLLQLSKRREMALSARKIRVASEILSAQLDVDAFRCFLDRWLADPEAKAFSVGLDVLGRMATRMEGQELQALARRLTVPRLQVLLDLITHCAGFPYGKELRLAASLVNHRDDQVRSWAAARAPNKTIEDRESPSASSSDMAPPPGTPPPLAPLWRPAASINWEAHVLDFAEKAMRIPGGMTGVLQLARTIADPEHRKLIWDAVLRVVFFWRYRDRAKFRAVCDGGFIDALVAELPAPCGKAAARILDKIYSTRMHRELLAAVRPKVEAILPDLAPEVRQELHWWIDCRGLTATVTDVFQRSPLAKSMEQRIRDCEDLDQLEEWCCGDDVNLAAEAALRLVELGPGGVARLASILTRAVPPPRAVLLAETISLWPEGPALEPIRRLVADPRTAAHLRFTAGMELLQRGERHQIDHVLEAVCTPGEVSWFRTRDWQRLVDQGYPAPWLSVRLARSHHPHAYQRVVKCLTALECPEPEELQAIVDFLECGTDRIRSTRVAAARWLKRQGDDRGFPVLLAASVNDPAARKDLLAGVRADLVHACVAAVLTAGPKIAKERWLLDCLVSPEDCRGRAEGLESLLVDGIFDPVHQAVADHMARTPARSWKLRSVAEEFAWGIRTGRELTGRLFDIEMIGGDQLGYTRLEQSKIAVNPLPILRQEEDGREIVRGLILHEIGHHLYHRDEEAQQIWEKAHREGMGQLLNLVADEHLERNLRATEQDFGNKLKRLAAYAFQHSQKEIPVDALLDSLSGRALEVLTATRLIAARRPGCVRVESGRVLREAERVQQSFSRFVRALRMGRGNRQRDTKVGEALKLFDRGFRNASMPRLLEVARRLRDIFGHEVRLLDTFDQDHMLSADGSEIIIHGEGIENAEVQQEVQRILRPPSRGRRGGNQQANRALLNVGPDQDFPPITQIERLAFDPVAHAACARQVARHSRQFRRYLAQLGLALRPQPRRVRGKSLDRGRIRDLVLRRDPRILVAREVHSVSDLFLGVLIDCSGSMTAGDHIGQAKLFGTMLAEAAKGFGGVDLRVFGFTDKVVYDAGDAYHPAVHALVAGGGNNDAAALWHAARVALASRRAARLLVMISDGLPTECSVTALRSLVGRLTRRMNICCAQVAVRPLEEVCFPHYIVLTEGNLDASVRRFGTIVARLVRTAMAQR